MDALARLWQSTLDLYERFGLDEPGAVEIQARERFLNEEFLELIRESVISDVLEIIETKHLLEEAADVLVTLVGLLQAHQIDLPSLEAACEFVAQKNDAKTLDTHEYIAGKIRKRI
jgi:NTP pyrophosphatase (non-canonical NTP hydrolase)